MVLYEGWVPNSAKSTHGTQGAALESRLYCFAVGRDDSCLLTRLRASAWPMTSMRRFVGWGMELRFGESRGRGRDGSGKDRQEERDEMR
jgi:hypothetical protein